MTAPAEDAEKVRAYVRQVDGAGWADAIPAEHLHRLAVAARARLRLSGKTRGWLGEVRGALMREGYGW